MNERLALKYLHRNLETGHKAYFFKSTNLDVWAKADRIYEFLVYRGPYRYCDYFEAYGKDNGDYVKIRRMVILGWIPWNDYYWVEQFNYKFRGDREIKVVGDAPGKIPTLSPPWYTPSGFSLNILGYKKTLVFQYAHIIYLNWLEWAEGKADTLAFPQILKNTPLLAISRESFSNHKMLTRILERTIMFFIYGWVPTEDPFWIDNFLHTHTQY